MASRTPGTANRESTQGCSVPGTESERTLPEGVVEAAPARAWSDMFDRLGSYERLWHT